MARAAWEGVRVSRWARTVCWQYSGVQCCCQVSSRECWRVMSASYWLWVGSDWECLASINGPNKIALPPPQESSLIYYQFTIFPRPPLRLSDLMDSELNLSDHLSPPHSHFLPQSNNLPPASLAYPPSLSELPKGGGTTTTLPYNPKMSSKLKMEYFHKLPQTTSPYIQLLEAKKKIFGYKYEIIRNDRPQPHNKSLTQPPTQPPVQPHQHSKTQSHEKEKPRSQKQNSRKKRSHTEQAEDRLHQSLFLNREVEHSQSKETKHQATKSLFTVEASHEQSLQVQDFRQYRMGDERNLKSYTQQVEGRRYGPQPSGGTSLQKLQIGEIDELLSLIDGCIEESNDYISYLTEKIETLRRDVQIARQQQTRIVKMKDSIIVEKDHEIDRLMKELHARNPPKPEEKTFEIKKLLEIVDRLNEENKQLRARLEEAGERWPAEKEKKDIYNEIHNRIDILNISIDKKNHDHPALPQPEHKDSKKSKQKPKFYK